MFRFVQFCPVLCSVFKPSNFILKAAKSGVEVINSRGGIFLLFLALSGLIRCIRIITKDLPDSVLGVPLTEHKKSLNATHSHLCERVINIYVYSFRHF